jgi:hypothetical protein
MAAGDITLKDTNDKGTGTPMAIWTDENFIYAACDAAGLRTYSVNPSGDLTFIHSDDQGHAYAGVWGDGTFIYAACEFGGLRTYSVDPSGNLTFIDEHLQGGIVGGNGYVSVWGDGNFIYVASQWQGIKSYSVDGGGFLTYKDVHWIGGSTVYRNVWGDGNFIYITTGQANGGLLTYTVDGSGNLTFVDKHYEVQVPANSYTDVWGDGNFLYVSSNARGVLTYTVDPSGNLTYVSRNLEAGDAWKVWGDGQLVYSTGNFTSYSVNPTGGLILLDSAPGSRGIWGDGNFVYVGIPNGILFSYEVEPSSSSYSSSSSSSVSSSSSSVSSSSSSSSVSSSSSSSSSSLSSSSSSSSSSVSSSSSSSSVSSSSSSVSETICTVGTHGLMKVTWGEFDYSWKTTTDPPAGYNKVISNKNICDLLSYVADGAFPYSTDNKLIFKQIRIVEDGTESDIQYEAVWVPSGSIYYADIVHYMGVQHTYAATLWDTETKEIYYPIEINFIDSKTMRVWAASSSPPNDSLLVIAGQGSLWSSSSSSSSSSLSSSSSSSSESSSSSSSSVSSSSESSSSSSSSLSSSSSSSSSSISSSSLSSSSSSFSSSSFSCVLVSAGGFQILEPFLEAGESRDYIGNLPYPVTPASAAPPPTTPYTLGAQPGGQLFEVITPKPNNSDNSLSYYSWGADPDNSNKPYLSMRSIVNNLEVSGSERQTEYKFTGKIDGDFSINFATPWSASTDSGVDVDGHRYFFRFFDLPTGGADWYVECGVLIWQTGIGGSSPYADYTPSAGVSNGRTKYTGDTFWQQSAGHRAKILRSGQTFQFYRNSDSKALDVTIADFPSEVGIEIIHTNGIRTDQRSEVRMDYFADTLSNAGCIIGETFSSSSSSSSTSSSSSSSSSSLSSSSSCPLGIPEGAYDYNTVSNLGGQSGSWVDLPNSTDGDPNTYARFDVWGSAQSDLLRFTGNTIPSGAEYGDIFGVKIRVKIASENTKVNPKLRNFTPRFDGVTPGTDYGTDQLPATIGAGGTIYTFDITNDAAGPGYKNWIWDDLRNLDIDFAFGNTSGALRNGYLFQIWVLVSFCGLSSSSSSSSFSSSSISISSSFSCVLTPSAGFQLQEPFLEKGVSENYGGGFDGCGNDCASAAPPPTTPYTNDSQPGGQLWNTTHPLSNNVDEWLKYGFISGDYVMESVVNDQDLSITDRKTRFVFTGSFDGNFSLHYTVAYSNTDGSGHDVDGHRQYLRIFDLPTSGADWYFEFGAALYHSGLNGTQPYYDYTPSAGVPTGRIQIDDPAMNGDYNLRLQRSGDTFHFNKGGGDYFSAPTITGFPSEVGLEIVHTNGDKSGEGTTVRYLYIGDFNSNAQCIFGETYSSSSSSSSSSVSSSSLSSSSSSLSSSSSSSTSSSSVSCEIVPDDSFDGSDGDSVDLQKWSILQADDPDGAYIKNNTLYFNPSASTVGDRLFVIESRNGFVGDFDIHIGHLGYFHGVNPTTENWFPQMQVVPASGGLGALEVAMIRNYKQTGGANRVGGRGTTAGFCNQGYDANPRDPGLRFTRIGDEIRGWTWYGPQSRWGSICAQASTTGALLSDYTGDVKIQIHLKAGDATTSTISLNDFVVNSADGIICAGSFSSSSTSSSSTAP